MALFRQVSRVSGLVKQCSKISASVYQSRGYANDPSQMAFTFASPSDVYYENKVVKQVDVPGYASSFGILAQHVPTIAVLKPGIVTVFEEDSTTKKYFVSSGTVTVNPDSTVQLLAEEAHPLERLDKEAIRTGFTKATQDLQSANGEKEKAKAQIALDCFEALSKAVE